MKLQRRNNLLFVAICLLAVVYSGSARPKEVKEVEAAPGVGPCCDFDTLNCADGSYNWEWSVSVPAPIPSPGSTYLWSTNDGEAIFPYLSTTYAINDFSLNYYIESPSDRLLVEFHSSYGRVSIGYLYYSTGSWDTQTFPGVDCCAGVYYTCSGQLVITSYMSGIGNYVAVDTVVMNGGISGTPKEAAPGIGTCCDFDTVNCADSSIDWEWSVSVPAPIPPSGSSYLWTTTSGAIAEFPIVNIVELNNDFTLNYYIEDSSDYLIVDFVSSNGPIAFGTLKSLTSSWESGIVSCTNIECCRGVSTCDGKLVIRGYVGVGKHAAVDTVVMNGGCFTTQLN
ncbi:hypothetical protein CHUAL_012061 [Chamberlinius hualienensis]